MTVPDYYAVVGVSRDATPEEIEKKIKSELRLWQRRTNSADLTRRQEAERRVEQLTQARTELLGNTQQPAHQPPTTPAPGEPEQRPPRPPNSAARPTPQQSPRPRPAPAETPAPQPDAPPQPPGTPVPPPTTGPPARKHRTILIYGGIAAVIAGGIAFSSSLTSTDSAEESAPPSTADSGEPSPASTAGSREPSPASTDIPERKESDATLTGHEDPVRSVAFSPDGTTLATAGRNGTVRLWDVDTGEPLTTLEHDHNRSVNSVAFSPDGTTLASGSDDDTVRLWSVP